VLDRFLAYLTRKGRRRTLVKYDGSVSAYRYFPFWVEEDEDPRRYPNLWIHQNVELETPDGPDSHRHPWNTYSYVHRGGYIQEVNGVRSWHGLWASLKFTDYHRIVRVRPGTVTLFFHGWRRGPWLFKLQACAALCETCAAKYGTCHNNVKTIPHEVFFGRNGKWRTARWFPSLLPGLDRMISRRKQAIRDRRVHRLPVDEVRARMSAERR
jgi:hypothetical protein